MDRNGIPAHSILPITWPHLVPACPRCEHCGGALEHQDGDPYCPDCTSFTLTEPPTTPTWFNATTTDGTYIHGDRDLETLIAWIRDMVAPEDDVVLTAGPRVMAVVCGDGCVVRVR
jgi:hypothetical protein